MKGMRRILAAVAVAGAVSLAGPLASAGATPCVGSPRFAGSFVQPWLPDSWSWTQFTNEFSLMSNVCINKVVLQWTADTDTASHSDGKSWTWYPTNLAGYEKAPDTNIDVVDNVLSAADDAGAQVYLGLNLDEGPWFSNNAYDRTWFLGQMTEANKIMDELNANYSSHPSLAGWYLPFEPWNEATNGSITQTQLQQNLADGIAQVANHAHSTTGKPLLISPFFNADSGLSSTAWTSMWQQVLGTAPIDTIALQDGVGAGKATVSQLPTWFSATKSAITSTRPSTAFWADSETYVAPAMTPMNVSQYVADMQAVQPYVSSYLSFSFNHYISSQQVDPSYYSAYEHWVETGTL